MYITSTSNCAYAPKSMYQFIYLRVRLYMPLCKKVASYFINFKSNKSRRNKYKQIQALTNAMASRKISWKMFFLNFVISFGYLCRRSPQLHTNNLIHINSFVCFFVCGCCCFCWRVLYS